MKSENCYEEKEQQPAQVSYCETRGSLVWFELGQAAFDHGLVAGAGCQEDGREGENSFLHGRITMVGLFYTNQAGPVGAASLRGCPRLKNRVGEGKKA